MQLFRMWIYIVLPIELPIELPIVLPIVLPHTPKPSSILTKPTTQAGLAQDPAAGYCQ